ncbi:hypothetical protein [Corynebacterium sp. Marseille-P4321]|uniref:hypothetical protein n=1 Tax=Corynebacterium sp. Marseille-P4321 TaxID=2736603 RepID=UPI00158A8C4A|nr:hypothetical protein [Corynebacterium sp. Marseille-P4321]
MRLTIEQIAVGFRVEESSIRNVVDQQLVTLDADGTLHHLLAQAVARYVSDEFTDLFGSSVNLPGSQLVFVQPGVAGCSGFTRAGISLLGRENLGIAPGGREYYQARSVDQLHAAGLTYLTNEMTNLGFLIRHEDTSEMQALADAYMLGDARIQAAVRKRIDSSSSTAA